MGGTTGPGLDDVVTPATAAWTVVGDGVIVHEQATRATYALGGTAAVLWRCLDDESTLGDIYADIAEAFAVDLSRVAADCTPVVESWITAGIAAPAGHPVAPTRDGTGARRWRRLPDPPNPCGQAELAAWPYASAIAVGDTLLCVGSDDESVWARLRPWQVDEPVSLVDFGIRTNTGPLYPGGPRALPAAQHGCDARLRDRDPAVAYVAFARSVAAAAEPVAEGTVALDGALLRRHGSAVVVPHEAVAAVSASWLRSQGWDVVVATHLTVRPGDRTVRVAAGFDGTSDAVVDTLTGWWLAAVDQITAPDDDEAGGALRAEAEASLADKVARAGGLLADLPAGELTGGSLAALASLVEALPPESAPRGAPGWRAALGHR